VIDRFIFYTIFGKTCDRSKYFKGIFVIDWFIPYTISGKTCDRSSNFKGIFVIDQFILYTISGKTYDRSYYFKGIFAIDRFIPYTISGKTCDRSYYFKGIFAIDWFIPYTIFGKTCDRSRNFKGVFAIDRFILCTISFKLANGPKISKEFLQLIAVFSVQFQRTCDRSVQIFKGIVRLVQLKGNYYSISGKVAINRIFNEGKIGSIVILVTSFAIDRNSFLPIFRLILISLQSLNP
jgi:hypothetical protein